MCNGSTSQLQRLAVVKPSNKIDTKSFGGMNNDCKNLISCNILRCLRGSYWSFHPSCKALLMWRDGDLPGGDTVGVLVGVVALFSPVLMGYLASNADSIAQNITAVIIGVFR